MYDSFPLQTTPHNLDLNHLRLEQQRFKNPQFTFTNLGHFCCNWTKQKQKQKPPILDFRSNQTKSNESESIHIFESRPNQ
ncbi:hypothetical protein QVD17_29216 [Tagetes erecta]|uniref:Uncharacterized protein n=1 Tax=Tagetes erecta TaxID=13708 RepID=A0AAD8KEG2_TARER|nr:hypothetical protein QVD17_29216 [Tagetes erecta]